MIITETQKSSQESPEIVLSDLVETKKKIVKERVKKVPRSKIRLKMSPKKSPVSKVGTRNGSPSPNLNTENRSPDPDLTTKIGSTSPDSRPQIGSPSPTLKPGKVEMGHKDEIGPLSSEKVVNCPKIHPRIIDSPSLKPVKIKNLIKSFEENIKIKNRNANGQEVKKMDAFVTLMMSGGDTPKKTSKKKPKRLKILTTYPSQE